MRAEIERVVVGIREGYDEGLTLTALSRMARLSPFHMARVFHEETGLPPAAFLTAVRMEEARRKLLHSRDSVADIAVQVGYTSLGAFTTRFTKTIGISPGRYRRLTELGPEAVDFVAGGDDAPFAYGSIVGRTRRSDGCTDEAVYIAAFPAGSGRGAAQPRRRLARCRRVQHSAGLWRIAHVPVGRWFVQAVSHGRAGRESIVVGTAGPVRVEPGAVIQVDLTLEAAHRQRPVDEARAALGGALPELFKA
ncbi:helix-turn-helix transcriptional regulator [Kitasatospora sp. NPDC056531]|uniref:helix-turn-helix transcriptional regulator n=1 Tax=Kitasatospora sp. NPDC056531 TaxID=3345856 RepID=UPI0036BF9CF5